MDAIDDLLHDGASNQEKIQDTKAATGGQQHETAALLDSIAQDSDSEDKVGEGINEKVVTIDNSSLTK